MAATGGGKIRSRRYHVVSKPYAKAKQQPGLISRVTDTVKSIVPSWLQKYFKNGELAEGEETPVQVEQNNLTAPPNGSQESAPLPDARHSPEPSTSNAEPSTSKASLNFQDVLSRPPLNRSHLHFPSLDGSPALSGSLFSQPSTSTAPPFPPSPFAVSSSFSLVKEIKDSSSQHEDDNISTTSGFSSRASDKDVPTSKTAPLLWSPETERTQSGSQLAHSSLKKPAFNLSVFGTSSSSAMNSSVLNSSQLGDSPFYPGKTTYGGAAAAKTARSRPGTPYHAPVRRQIKAKPAGAQPCGVTSATARRILQSLERMSSPLADAKRIPSTVSSPLSTSLNHSDLDGSSNFQSKRKKLEPAVPPVQKLVIPAVAAVSGNRSMSFRPSLTPGSVSRVLEKSSKDTPVRRSPQVTDAVPAATASTSGLSYPLSSTPAASVTSGGGGKMKRERSVRPSTKRPDDEVVEVPNLPSVSLPISNFNLPTFSFSSPPPASTLTPSITPAPRVSEKAAVSKENNKESTPVSVSFTFSSPIVKATAASPPSFSPSSGFTFSAPTMKTGISMSNGKLPPAKVKTAGEISEEFEGPFKPAKTLKQGSVLDVLKGPGFSSSSQKSSITREAKNRNTTAQLFSTSLPGFGEKFKPAAGSWNCGTCMVQNKPSDKKCVACQAPQPSTDSSAKSDGKPAKAPAASLSSLFAPPAGSWECDTCLVQNKPEVVKCVACDTAKPGTGVKPALTRPPVSEVSSTLPASTNPAITSTSSSSSSTTTTAAGTTSGLLRFADKFKKPEGTWSCDVCMLDNKAQDVKCVACQSAKPGAAAAPSASTPARTVPLLGFGDKFKKPEGSWDCDVCCVQNKAEDQKCVSCKTPKPGAKVETKGFGMQSSSTNSTSTSSFKFGAPTTTSSNSTSVEVKFGGSFSNSTSSSSSFKFGSASSDSTAPSSGFKFGTSSSDSSSGAFKFGGAPTEQTSTGPASTEALKFGGSSNGFKFGADSTSGSTGEEKKSETQNPGAGFKFGGSTTIGFGSTSTTTTATTPSQGFSFGLSKPPEEKTGSNPSFSFSAPKASEAEKENPLPSRGAILDTSNTAILFSDSLSPEADQTTGQLFGEETPQKTSTAAFMFGKPEEKKDTSTISTGFMFSATKEAAKPAATTVGFNFNKPDPTKEVPKSTFTFGKPAEPAETQKPVFGFGQNATDKAAPKPAFAFMGGSSTAPAAAAAPASSSLFGTPSSSSLAPTPAPSSTFVFGQGSSSETPSKTFMFGQQQQETQPASTEPPAAGAAPNQSQPFMFGTVNSSTASPFAFGAASSAPASSFGAASSAPASSFGAASSAPASSFGAASSAPASSFGAASSAPASSFGAASSAPASTAPAPSPFGFTATTSASGFGSGQTPAFGSSQSAVPVFGSAASSFTATQSATTAPAFGAKPNTQSVFGQQPNSTPAFGSSTAPSGQGSFQFGGNNAFGATGGSSNSSVFTFGAGAAGATGSPAGAPAMSAQPAAPGGGFGFSPSAAFNIGSAKNANAPPNRQHAIAGRKIKTAVRRRK